MADSCWILALAAAIGWTGFVLEFTRGRHLWRRARGPIKTPNAERAARDKLRAEEKRLINVLAEEIGKEARAQGLSPTKAELLEDARRSLREAHLI